LLPLNHLYYFPLFHLNTDFFGATICHILRNLSQKFDIKGRSQPFKDHSRQFTPDLITSTQKTGTEQIKTNLSNRLTTSSLIKHPGTVRASNLRQQKFATFVLFVVASRLQSIIYRLCFQSNQNEWKPLKSFPPHLEVLAASKSDLKNLPT